MVFQWTQGNEVGKRLWDLWDLSKGKERVREMVRLGFILGLYPRCVFVTTYV